MEDTTILPINKKIRSLAIVLFCIAAFSKLFAQMSGTLYMYDDNLIDYYYIIDLISIVFASFAVFLSTDAKWIKYSFGFISSLFSVFTADMFIRDSNRFISTPYYMFYGALVWVIIALMFRITTGKSEYFRKTISECIKFLSMINLYDEIFGVPTAYEMFEFVSLNITICYFGLSLVVRYLGGFRKNLNSIFEFYGIKFRFKL